MLLQWDRLEECLKDGRVETGDNWCKGGCAPSHCG